MKIMLNILFLSLVLFLEGCLPPAAQVAQDETEDAKIQTREPDPIAVDCRVLGYTTLRSLLSDALEIPNNAVLFNGQTLETFLNDQRTALGGSGSTEVRECSLTYIKAVSQLAVYACHWAGQNNLLTLFPQGSNDASTLFQKFTGLNPDGSEIRALQDLMESIENFDNNTFASLQSKRAAAACTAIFTSMAAQTI